MAEHAAPRASPLPPVRLNLEQRRAKHAWSIAERIEKDHVRPDKSGQSLPDSFAKDYTRQAKKLPARILGSGLGQALTFVYGKSRGSQANSQLLNDLVDWLLVHRKSALSKGGFSESAIIEEIMRTDGSFLRFASAEILAYLVWLNRFLEAKGWAKDDIAENTES